MGTSSQNVVRVILAALIILVLIGLATYTVLHPKWLGNILPGSQGAAAVLPTLATAGTFSILAQTEITDVPSSVISGDVGMNNFSSQITGLTSSEVAGTIYATDAVPVAPGEAVLPASVQQDAAAAFNTGIPSQPSDGTIGPALDGLTLTPGVYDLGAGLLSGGVLHLKGQGIYILRASSSLTSSGSIRLENGARACDVFWRVQTLATINGSSFVGTILAGAGIHFGANVTLNGRALAIGNNVTLISDTITGPDCIGSALAPAASSQVGNINVVKTVINDSGGTKTVADFPLFVNGSPVVSGVTNSFPAPGPAYAVTETGNTGYTQTFSGGCDSNGNIGLSPGDNRFCIITNNDIGPPAPVVPPLIDVVKTASPLSLPAGPGSVTYTYTLRNIGTVPVTNVTLVGDTCSPITNPTGDTNNNAKLEVSETWVYHCTTTLNATHTNTVVATGWANGISATDIANATVVVGAPIIPPLIHVVKRPNVFLLSAPGGAVTYTYTVTNPGTAPLSDVSITDNKCTGLPGRVTGHPGDLNNNNLLESNETWSFACQTNLTQTTTNIGTAVGSANGLTATDFSLATVVVAAPKLPNTGLSPEGK